MNTYAINISHRTFGSAFQEIEASSAPRAVQQAIDFMFPRNAASPIPDLDQALAFGDVTIELKLVKVATRFREQAGHDPAFSLVSDPASRPELPDSNTSGHSQTSPRAKCPECGHDQSQHYDGDGCIGLGCRGCWRVFPR